MVADPGEGPGGPGPPLFLDQTEARGAQKKMTTWLTCLHNDHILACMISELKEKGYQLDLKSLQ